MASVRGLLEAVPPRLRFSAAPGAAAARSLLLRNISAGALPVRIDLPGAPFRLVQGAERLDGEVVRLESGEELPLRIAWDRNDLPPGRDKLCKFLVVRLDMYRPLAVEIVVVPDDMSKEDVLRFAERCLPEELRQPPPPAVGGSHVGGAAGGALGEVGPHAGGDAAQLPDEARLALLTAFLGEAPAPAAMRQQPSQHLGAGDPGGGLWPESSGDAGARGRGRCAGRSSASSASSSPGREPRPSRGFSDDDRPPTPTPEGFECAPRPVRVARRAAPSEPDSPAANRGGRVDMGSDDDTSPADAPLRSVGDEMHSRRRQGTSASCAETRVVDVAAFGQARAAQPHPPDGMDDLFFVDGVGWCDAYGNVVEGVGGGAGSRTAALPGRCGGDAGRAGAHASTAPAPRRGRSDPRASTDARKPGADRQGRRGPSPQAAGPRRAKKDLDAAWDALGGI